MKLHLALSPSVPDLRFKQGVASHCSAGLFRRCLLSTAGQVGQLVLSVRQPLGLLATRRGGLHLSCPCDGILAVMTRVHCFVLPNIPLLSALD